MKPDDCTLSAADLVNVRKYAALLLRRADAMGRFPTPVPDLVSAARLAIARDVSLDAGFLKRVYRRVSGPVKRAIQKVLGLLDVRERTVYLDQTVHRNKEPFLSIHEAGHEFLPWQRDTYAFLEDSEYSLEAEIRDKFEREANNFACEVLFQLDAFRDEAADCPFGLRTPLQLAKRYGTSCYAAIRRYVTTNPRACAVLVFDPPVYEANSGYTATLRQFAQSPRFTERFGKVAWPASCRTGHFLCSVLPAGRAFARPRHCRVRRVDQQWERCVVEAFNSTYQVFVLICPESELRRPSILVAG